ncbi:MAG: CBS domain-containing protein, partial [Saprospiraceae bacterium]|nr:CBS domain-containing protein [Saprospiraceae bacterium]
ALPRVLAGGGLREVHSEIDELIALVARAARPADARVLLAGIAPTLRHRDVSREMMTPDARYRELDAALRELRRGPFHVFLRGIDELEIESDSVMLEACNTSFQVHLQVDADEFTPMYNAAQWITAALVGVAANAPCLFGKRLWHETRIGLFEQSVDDRLARDRTIARRGRVSFGEDWLRGPVTDLFRDDIMRI